MPAGGIDLLRGTSGGNTHTLVADPGTYEWTNHVVDPTGLALGMLRVS